MIKEGVIRLIDFDIAGYFYIKDDITEKERMSGTQKWIAPEINELQQTDEDDFNLIDNK